MKKRISLILVLAVIFTLLSGGCSESNTTVLDLRGTWSDLENGSQMAVIDDDTISIYWGNEDASSLYWTGTYEAPTTETEKYSWESKNYHDVTDFEFLASTDDSKTIVYDSGCLTYEMSALGVTKIVKLSRTDIPGLQTRKSSEIQ